MIACHFPHPLRIIKNPNSSPTINSTNSVPSLELNPKQQHFKSLSNRVNFGSPSLIEVSHHDLISRLKKCAQSKSLSEGRALHALILKLNPENDCSLTSALINMYSRNRFFDETISLYSQLKKSEQTPEVFTYPCVLKLCSSIFYFHIGRAIHNHIIRSGFESNVFVGNALISFYGKFGRIENACHLFDNLSDRDCVSWNALILCYLENGFPYFGLLICKEMIELGFQPDRVTVITVLSACAQLKALKQGKELHVYLLKKGLEPDGPVNSSLLHMYAKCGNREYAREVFNRIRKPDLISWSSIIRAYAQTDCEVSLKLFKEMLLMGFNPDPILVSILLSSIAEGRYLELGRQIHNFIVRFGLENNVAVGSSLIDMYAKCRKIELSRRVFDRICHLNVIYWNSIISAYSQSSNRLEAVNIFTKMQFLGITPNSGTFISLLAICAEESLLKHGRVIHQFLMKSQHRSDMLLNSALIGMYAKCGKIELAHMIFNQIPKRSIESSAVWNVMISACAQNGLAIDSLKLYNQMLLEDLKPDPSATLSAVSSCAKLASIKHGKQIHSYTIKTGLKPDVLISSSLIDMYSKGGDLDSARSLFNRLSEKTTVSWNVMISGCGANGCGDEAFLLYKQMQEDGRFKPDYVTFIAVLSACSHGGLIKEAWTCFNSMKKDHNISPGIEHYSCLVDLLGRSGRLYEAFEFINKMSIEAAPCIWGSFLNACRIHKNAELGRIAAEHLFEIEPENTGNYVLLANLYSDVGRDLDAIGVRRLMKIRGLSKEPGFSWIEVSNQLHMFVSNDFSHPQTGRIYSLLERLTKEMEEMGYVPYTDSQCC